jgi:hypothetical protein
LPIAARSVMHGPAPVSLLRVSSLITAECLITAGGICGNAGAGSAERWMMQR